jgi:hypothetical protein
MLMRIIAVDLLAGAALIALWYFTFRRYNRRRSAQVLRWIQRAFAAHGEVSGVRWLGASRFHVSLRLATNLFHRAAVMVQLLPREMPFHWLLNRLRKKRETLTFEADLDCPPGFDLEVHNHRWCGRTRRKFPKNPQNWTTERAGPFVLTTRKDWQREVTTMMNALGASRECDCLSVCFRRTSPHFSATVPLESISPAGQEQPDIFDVLRELAAGASTSRF